MSGALGAVGTLRLAAPGLGSRRSPALAGAGQLRRPVQALPVAARRRSRGGALRVAAYKSPVHRKYVTKTKEELDEAYAKEWIETTAHQVAQVREPTFWSVMAYVPQFIRFRIIPEPIRYLMHLAWLPLRPFAAALERRLLLAGAKLDALLARLHKGAPGRKLLSIQEVLRRAHGKATPLRKIKYRIDLLKGKTIEELDDEALEAQRMEAIRLAAAIDAYVNAANGTGAQP
mmetsp:Transcript_16298/g.40926  ORF Transcript_16298/g.40926 Transcript_16298/m.40926 type:complete len:231 (-) Transcript_16298:27-719(-)